MYADIHQQVTDTILKQLEKGVAPWNKPWQERVGFKLPVNGTTNKAYNGINIILLWASTEDNGFHTNEWGTFQQWKEKKEFVRKGEKGTMIVYYDTMMRPDKDNEDEIKKIPFIKASYVFNRSQLQSFNPETVIDPTQKPLVERIERVDKFVKDTGITVETKNGRGACYIPALDKVIMPEIHNFQDQKDCTAAEAYYSTLFHELGHATGAAHRLNRKLSTSFGSEKYAQEELVAEFVASFECAEFGIEKAPVENHAAYIQSWLKTLKNDKHMAIKAASEASKASSFLHRLQEERAQTSNLCYER